MDSILNSIKALLGITATNTDFDVEIIMHINSVFLTLNQLGVGPTDVHQIVSEENLWTTFMSDATDLEAVKSYIYLKVKLLFDTPQSGPLVNSINSQTQELEWRLTLQEDPYDLTAAAEAEEAEEEEEDE